jgi:hypothetical protein
VEHRRAERRVEVKLMTEETRSFTMVSAWIRPGMNPMFSVALQVHLEKVSEITAHLA